MGRVLVWFCLVLSVGGCAHFLEGRFAQDRGFNVYDMRTGSAEKVNLSGLSLDSGQIVLAESGGPLSLFFSLFAQEYSATGHGGILMLENGRPFVYESVGIVKPSFFNPPTVGVSGGIRRTKLRKFLRRNIYTEIHNPPADVDRSKMIEFVRRHFEAKTPFDAYFDFSEHKRLYCTEMIALALEAGGSDPVELTKNRRNPSLEVARDWLGISNAGGVLARSLVLDGVLVAIATNQSDLTEALVEVGVMEELHRRFTVSQKLGNLFAWKFGALAYRDDIKRLIKKAHSAFDSSDPITNRFEISEKVSVLAEGFYGPTR